MNKTKGNIVPGEQVGLVSIGMLPEEVVALMGQPDDDSDSTYLNYQKEGLSFLFSLGAVRTIFIYSSEPGGYDTGIYEQFNGSLANNIDFDCSYEEVLKHNGEPIGYDEMLTAPIPTKSILYSGIWLNFVHETDKMYSMAVQEKSMGVSSDRFLDSHLEAHNNIRIAGIQKKIGQLQLSVESAFEQWKPYEKCCISDYIKDIKELKVEFVQTIAESELKVFEEKFNINFPIVYKEFLQAVGAFSIGENAEILLRAPSQIYSSLGELIEDKIPEEHRVDNIKNGHYHDFLILAEYGDFPEEINGYPYGLAFNKNDPSELIIYCSDATWFADTAEKRAASQAEDVFYHFLEFNLQSLIDRVNYLVEELNEEIEYFKNEEW